MNLETVCIYDFWWTAYCSEIKTVFAFLDIVLHGATLTVELDYFFCFGIHVCDDKRVHANELPSRFFDLAYNSARVIPGFCLVKKLTIADCVRNHVISSDFCKLRIYIRCKFTKDTILFQTDGIRNAIGFTLMIEFRLCKSAVSSE